MFCMLSLIIYKVAYDILDLLCRDVAQLGSAAALGAVGRRFESYRPDIKLILD